MEEDKKSIEERAKEFFNSRGDLNLGGLHPADVNNLYEYIAEINYLVERRYIREIGDIVKAFRYVATAEGRKWANS